jgi:DNA-binding NtrC family response regulator
MSHILCIDDDNPTLEVYRATLGAMGHTTTCVATLEDAAVCLDLMTPDAVITDGYFPSKPGSPVRDCGLDVASMCWRRKIPCVVHTGGVDIREVAERLGYTVREKPTSVAKLLEALQPDTCPHCLRRAPVHARGGV